MSKTMSPAEEYELLRGLITQHGFQNLENMLHIADASLRVTPEMMSEATAKAAELANGQERNIGILFNPRGSKKLFAFVYADAQNVDRHCIILTVSPDGEIAEGPAAQSIPVQGR